MLYVRDGNNNIHFLFLIYIIRYCEKQNHFTFNLSPTPFEITEQNFHTQEISLNLFCITKHVGEEELKENFIHS